MMYEWILFGGIPLLSENLETSRFNISAGTIFHVSAISLKITTIYMGIYLIMNYKESKKIDLLSHLKHSYVHVRSFFELKI